MTASPLNMSSAQTRVNTLNFSPAQPSDKPWVEPFIRSANSANSAWTFANLYLWGSTFQQEVAQLDTRLAVRLYYQDSLFYAFPVGTGDLQAAVLALLEDASAQNAPLQFLGVTEKSCTELEEAFPGSFDFIEEPFIADYVYEAEKLAHLPGKKLSSKRNHINRFLENHPDWHFEAITPKNLDSCIQMSREWLNQQQDKGNFSGDLEPLRLAFEHFEALGLEGGLLMADNQVVAFTLGEILNSDTYVVHFEKAFASIQGAYPMINREFVRHVLEKYPHIRYINREEDMGLEHLQKAKRSYYPDHMVNKYTAIWRGL